MSSRHSEVLVRLATALRREGLASLRFDFSGNGDSGGRFKYGHYWDEAAELRSAKQWVEANHPLEVAGLVGHSKGATSSILYASKYGDVPRVVNLAGRFDVREGVVRRLGAAVLQRLEAEGQVEMQGRSKARGPFTWTLTQRDLDDRLSTDVAAAASSVPRAVRVLTVHGTDDADVPVGQARKFAAAIPSHELLLLEGGDHTFSTPAQQMALIPRVVGFLAAEAAAAAGAGE